MKRRMEPIGYIFAIVFALLGQLWCEPVEPEPAPRITAPALHQEA